MQRMLALGLIAGAMTFASSEAEACRNCGRRACVGCGYGYGGYGYGGYGGAYSYGGYYGGGGSGWGGWGGWGYGSGYGNASLYGYAGNSAYSYGWPYSYNTYYRPAYSSYSASPYYWPDFGSYSLYSPRWYGGYGTSLYGYPVGYPTSIPYSAAYRGVIGAPGCDTCGSVQPACDNCASGTQAAPFRPDSSTPYGAPGAPSVTPIPPQPQQQEAPAPGPDSTPIEKRIPPAPKSAALPQLRAPMLVVEDGPIITPALP